MVRPKLKIVTTTTTSTILYVDDDSDDCMFFSQSFSEVNNMETVICAKDGNEAVQYLSPHSKLQIKALPSLIVLDLNMPKWDGKKTLKYMKSDPVLGSIPVIIMSTSYNSIVYYVKPFYISELNNIVQQL
jgi:CheY-like chemotaxis protein